MWNCFCHALPRSQYQCMSMDLDLRFVVVSFIIMVANLLSNWMGVGPWRCLISSRMVRVGKASRVLMYPTPVYDSWTEDMTESMNFLLMSIGALRVGGGSVDFIGSLGLSES